jgi:hypothetical protein
MNQITFRSLSNSGVPQGPFIPLEVATFDETRKAKLRTYSRVQAFSDTSLIVGVYNPEFTISVAIPQDFNRGEDIETLLAGLQTQDQYFVDAEGLGRRVRITNISTSHTGGQPYYYTADITMKALDNNVVQCVFGYMGSSESAVTTKL